MFGDCIYVPVKRGRGARNVAVYCIVAYDLEGRKDVLGLWMESEGAHHWMGVFDELRGRAGSRTLFVSMDGVAGPADGLRAIRAPWRSAASCTWCATRAKYVPVQGHAGVLPGRLGLSLRRAVAGQRAGRPSPTRRGGRAYLAPWA